MDARLHELCITTPPRPLHIDGDAVRLTQVIANLLSNAAQYSEERSRIRLHAETTGSGDHPEVVIRVRDSGIGISPDDLAHIFELFRQLEQPTRREAVSVWASPCRVGWWNCTAEP